MPRQMVYIRLGDDLSKLNGPEMRATTAHAGPRGYIKVTHHEGPDGSRLEAVSISRYGGFEHPMSSRLATAVLNDIEGTEHRDPDNISFLEAARELGRFRAFGESSNFSELKAERIGYSPLNEDHKWEEETIVFSDGRSFVARKELRFHEEMDNPNAPKGEILEPLTIEEATKVIAAFDPESLVIGETKEVLLRSVGSYIQPELERAYNFLKHKHEGTEMMQHDIMRRIRITIERQNLGAGWTYQDSYEFGEREGTTTGVQQQNDENFTKQRQHQDLYERVDGKLVFAQELWMAERRGPAKRRAWQELFYAGGEKICPCEEDKKCNCRRAQRGQNRGWTEQRLYMRRQAQTREERVARLLWHICTWPLPMAEKLLERIKERYKQSVRQCSPGPKRALVDGRWQSVPLQGQEAIAALRKNTAGIKGGKPHPQIRYHRGPHWHKLFLKQDHLALLEEALLWRKGQVVTSFGDKLEQQPIQAVEGHLPAEYVQKKYLQG